MASDKKLDSRTTGERFDWSDIKVFLQVAECGSINAASRALRLSQPTVSQNIRDLELRLNTQLFVRNAAGVELTQAGALLRERALPMQRAAQTIDYMLRELDDKPEGRVKVAAPDGILSFWLAPRIRAFQDANPGIALSLDGGLWPAHPLQSGLDISLQYDQTALGDRVVEPLATIHYVAAASRDYLKRHGTPQSLAEIATHRTVHHVAVQQQRETWDSRAEAARTLSAHNIETNSSSVMAFAVLSGAGVSFLPSFAKAMFEDLEMIGDATVASPVLYLVYDPRVARVARCEAVLNWLREAFDPATNPWFQSDFVHPREFGPVGPAGRLQFTPPVA
ncbi:MAG: LysR family transcriptional regulator [Proteobacteria bacterium]|nr:LysR family transcriptional regulator [Pseudomonadota bacterium]